MSNGEVFTANHRCKKRLYNARILKDYHLNSGFVYSGWFLFRIAPDFRLSGYTTREVAPIRYCPFCGEKLKCEEEY